MARNIRSTATTADGGDSQLERLPENLLNEIFSKLEPETLTTLCSIACVSRTLQSSANNALSSFSSIDLSAFSLDSQSFNGTRTRFGKIKKITLDCLRLSDSSIESLLGADVEELVLLKCSSLSYNLLASIGRTCPNIRALTLEFSRFIDKPSIFELNLERSFANCQYLESLRIKARGSEIDDYNYMLLGICHSLPSSIKVLTLDPITALDFFLYLKTFPPIPFGQTLTHVSLVLDTITDPLLQLIAHSLPQLTELHLKDHPTTICEPLSSELSDLGIHSLVHCKHLNSLSLIRMRNNISSSFKYITDMGMFLLSEGCKQLESVRFGGFSKVSDAGFTSILNSCLNLKKFEIQNASLLSDLAFQDFSKVGRCLVEVKLVSCGFITSEGVCEVAKCDSLEVLDFNGCRSVANSCIGNITKLKLLSHLNLSGADVTDLGMELLGNGNSPISFLSLRGCKRVSEKGIFLLFRNNKKIINKTLSSLDVSYMSGINDNAIKTIVENCLGLMELSVRNCFNISDESIKLLGLKGRFEDEKGERSKNLRKVDVHNCIGLTVESFEFLKNKTYFRGLRWVGLGLTRLTRVGEDGLADVYRERRWLTMCIDGCEMGCRDGWQFHKFGSLAL